MLKTYGEISRFMDGPALNITPNFIYLKDAIGKERIGKPYFGHHIDKSLLVLDDITSKKRLEFEGDHLRIGSCPHQFSWFPSIQEIGVLYDDFDNDVQREGVMLHNFKDFLLNELFFEIAQRQGMPIGEREKGRMADRLNTPALLYAHSVELLYAGLNENRDILIAAYIESKPSSRAKDSIVHNPIRGIEFHLDGNFNGFLEANPELREHITDGGVSAEKVYDTPQKVIDELRKSIPADVLESMYQQFKAGIEGRKVLEVKRAENPRERLEEQVKDVDTKGYYGISLTHFKEDLKRRVDK